MFEINLLPGATRRTKRRAALPSLGGRARPSIPSLDRKALIVAAVWIVGLGAAAWMHFSSTGRMAELRVAEAAAVRDSIRYATLRMQGDSLRQQQELIAQRQQVLQEIDDGRYVWPHILDEASRALPPYVWLVNMTDAVGDGSFPRVRIEGVAGNTIALTQYMEALESSPFLAGTRLLSSRMARLDNRDVHNFVLEVGYQQPPADAIQTVPLFGARTQED